MSKLTKSDLYEMMEKPKLQRMVRVWVGRTKHIGWVDGAKMDDNFWYIDTDPDKDEGTVYHVSNIFGL